MATIGWLVVWGLVLVPQLSLADDGLVQCGRGNSEMCTFADFISLLNRLMEFILYYIATPLAAILIIYAGMRMVIYASNSGEISAAKKIIYRAIGGLVLALAAYIIIKFIVVFLTGDTSLFSNTTEF